MQIKSHSILIRFAVIAVFSFMLYGCGVWANFTTYFNLYYDAKDLFSQAEDEIALQGNDIFALDEPAIAATTNTELVKVEEKCSQILQFHAQSSYVDESLFMIGKCFYYQASYRKALRKFEELIATQPKSSLILQTRLWIGKSQMRLKEFEDGLATLKSAREAAISQNEREIAQDCYIEEIRYHIYKKDYTTAIDLAKNFLEISKDDDLNAVVAYEIGKLYNLMGDYSNSIAYYRKVRDYSPTYDLRFKSSMDEGKALRETGDNEKALQIFNQLSNEQKYVDALDQIDYERGITYLKMNNTDKAVDLFMYVDTSFAKMPSAGKCAYELGNIFLEKYRNFDTAAYYFNRVFQSTAPPEVVALARVSSEQLRKYEVLNMEVQENYKQLTYALDSTAFIKDSIAFYEEVNRKLKEAHEDSLRFKDDKVVKPVNNTNQQAAQNPDQRQQQGQNQQNPNQIPNQNPQQNNQFQQRGVNQNPQQTAGNQFAQNNTANVLQWQQLKIQKKPPMRPKLPVDTLTYNLVKSEYEIGNLLIAEFNMPDSAYKYYSDIMTNYPASPYDGRVTFAMGNYYLAINDTVKADSLFNVVYDKYKNESVVNNAAIKLNKPLVDYNFDPAKELYASAEAMMNKAAYDSSITSMYTIYHVHPKSMFASKALYAIGWMLENKNLNDSAAVVYDTLIARYPHSVYANDIMPKLNYYKNELQRIQKAKEDSLYALSHPKTIDTTLSKNPKNEKLAANEKSELPVKKTIGNEKTNNPVEATKENIPQNLNAPANPDTLIRIRGRGMRRDLR